MAIDAHILDSVTQEFLKPIRYDAVIIQAAARELFYYLVTIQIALSSIWMMINGESLSRYFAKLVEFSFNFGVLYALILYGGQWIPDLINGFINIGQHAGIESLDPSSILSQGLSISWAIFKAFFDWGLLKHPFVAMTAVFLCIGIMVMYAFIAAELAVILVKTYVTVAVGSLFFAFGASDYTSGMTKRYLGAAIGLGLQLMTLYLLLAIGQNIGADWALKTHMAAQKHDLIPMFIIMGAVIIYYLLIKNVPTFVAGLSGVGGFRNYGDAAVGMAINAGMTAASAVSSGANLAGKLIAGKVQATQGMAHILKSGMQAAGQGNSFGQSAMSGLKHGLSTLGVGTANTVKDLATRQNQNKTLGQKFNLHAANKVKNLNTQLEKEGNAKWKTGA